MMWIIHISMLVALTTNLVFGRDPFEHMTIASALPQNAFDPHRAYMYDGDPQEIYEKHVKGIDSTDLIPKRIKLAHPLLSVYSCDVSYRQSKLFLYEYITTTIIGVSGFDWRTDFQNASFSAFHTGLSRSVYTRVAVDYVSDNVYWVDPVFRWIAVQPGNLNTIDKSNFKILVHEDLRQPTALAVSPKHGLMFWSDSGRVVKIEKANLIGQDRKAIISTGLIMPVSIDVDYESNKIYWVDPERDTIECSDMDGNNRATIRRMSHTTLLDIVVLGEVLTVIDYTNGNMHILNKDTGTDLYAFQSPTQDKWGALCLYTPDSQPSVNDKCPAKHCEDICVNGPAAATCLCREGYQLNLDERTCSEAEGERHKALVVAGSKGICTLDIRSLSSESYDNTTCFPGVQGLNYIDMDMVNRKIYYATETEIYSVMIDGDSEATRIVSLTETITGMALDWLDENIYMSLGQEKGKIQLFSQTTNSPYVILDTDLNNPRELFLLPLDRLMIWISGSLVNFKIEKAVMDGTDRTTVLGADQLSNPYSISVDPTTLLLYWTDSGIIKRCTLDGLNVEVLSIEDVVSAKLVHIYKNYLIFTDDEQDGTHIKTDDLTGPMYTNNDFTAVSVGMLKAIKTLDAHSQPSKKGPCDVLNGDCEHICLPLGQTKICKCDYGFMLDDNRETCSSTPVYENILFVTDWTHDKIYQISFDTLEVIGLDIPEISDPTGVVYNHVTKQVIWGDSSENLIHRINLNGTGYQILTKLELSGCHADRFAIDFSTGNIFYTAVPTKEYGFLGIGVISPLGDHRRLIQDNGGERPRDIVLDPEDGWLFWTDHGTVPFVKKAHLDGSSVTTIITTLIKWPNGLAIDQEANQLYLTDGLLNTIRRCSYTGSCTTIYTADNAHLMDITLSGQYLYFTAWNSQHIIKMNKNNVDDTAVVVEKSELGRLDSLAVYEPSVASNTVSAACANRNGGCSMFCFATSANSRACACEDGVSLLSDMKTCENFIPTTPATISTTMAPPTISTVKEPIKATKSPPIAAIAGGAVGGLLFIAALVIAIVLFKRCSRSKTPPFDQGNMYIEPTSDANAGAVGGNDSEYDYIGLNNVNTRNEECSKTREDDARKSANVYTVMQPSPLPNRAPAGIDHLSTNMQRQSTMNDYLSFNGKTDNAPMQSSNQHYYYGGQSSAPYLSNAPYQGSAPYPSAPYQSNAQDASNAQYIPSSAVAQPLGRSSNIRNQTYGVADQGQENIGFGQEEDQTTPKSPRRDVARQQGWATFDDNASAEDDYMTPTPSVRGYSADA